jgi:hypothetical protein
MFSILQAVVSGNGNSLITLAATINPEATRGLEPISYRGVLVSTLLHATVYVLLHNLINVLVQTANKMGFKKNLDIKKVI